MPTDSAVYKYLSQIRLIVTNERNANHIAFELEKKLFKTLQGLYLTCTDGRYGDKLRQ